jgi:predicted amidohydrolase YtcJ
MPHAHAHRVFQGGHIHTLDPQHPHAQALAVTYGRLVAVGSVDEVAGLIGPSTVVTDLAGATVVPGFHDAHCHILLFGLSLVETNTRAAASIAEVVEAVGRRASALPGGAWLRGGGYNENKLAEQRHPTRHDLDPVTLENPAFLSHISGHMAIANSRALSLAGIARDTPDPPGGAIDRDAHGKPTGLLKETAQELVKRVLPPYSLAETRQALAAAGQQMAAEGITSAQEAWAGWIAPEEFRAYQAASADGSLPQRVRLMVDVERLAVKDGRFDFAFGLNTGFGTDRLKLGAIKLFLDGSLIGRTAALSQPYDNAPGTAGMLVKRQAQINAQVALAHAGGWQVAMHAIGDAAIEAGLEAIEAVMGPEAARFRPRLEHCGILRPDLIERIRKLGVVVVTQPRFIYELGDGFRAALGEARLRLTYPFASLRGLRVAFSSDRPVVNGAPLLGMQAATLQRTASGAAYVPEEAISAAEALHAYTLGAAYSAFAEEETGSLREGKWADFVVLSDDPLRAEPAAFGTIPVLKTVVGGEVVYSA